MPGSPAPPTRPSVVKNAANSGDPNVRNATFVKGNVIWLALNQVGGTISQQEKELIMSVIGSVILYPPADDGSGAMPRYIEPSIVGLRDLLLGSGASATEGNVDIEVYVCDEAAECLNPCAPPSPPNPSRAWCPSGCAACPTTSPRAAPQTPADIGFINNTTEPVYKMLAVANAVPGSNTAETLIETYKDVIALDYAETFLSRAIRQALSALSQTLKRTGVEQQYVETLRQNAQEAQRQLLAEKQTAYAKVRSVSSMTQDLQTLERQLWSSMPSTVKAMLDFSANSGARGS
jgi:conjugative transfer pilus assembly protein TraH